MLLSVLQGDGSLQEKLIILVFGVVSVLIAMCVHEFAHAYVAYLLGDTTAKTDGRMSLNPLHHIDPIGTLLLFVVGFGWAKPVMINPLNFRSAKAGTILVSLAGVFTNYVVGYLSFAVYWLLLEFFETSVVAVTISQFFLYLSVVNVGLCVFNLLPIPPLDGSRIVEALLPVRAALKYASFAKYSYAVFFAVIVLSEFLNVSVFDYILSLPTEFIFNSYSTGITVLLGLIGRKVFA